MLMIEDIPSHFTIIKYNQSDVPDSHPIGFQSESFVKEDSCIDIAPLNQIKVLSYKDKGDWTLEQKYNIGKRGKTEEETR